MRSAGEEARRVTWEKRLQRCRDSISEFVLFDPIPDVEDKRATRFENPACFRIRLRFIWKEHDAELAYHRVERRMLKGKSHGIRLAPFDRALRANAGSMVEHRL